MDFDQKTISGINGHKTWAVLCSSLLLPLFVYGAGPALVEPIKPDPPAPRTSADRTGVLVTKDGLTLRLSADLGAVHIVSSETNGPPLVHYTVHLETDARANAQQLLDGYVLKVKNNAAGVEINGKLPAQLVHSSKAASQMWIQFEITVPKDYSVDVKTDGGDIETQDIGGTAALVTLGGNIRTGRIGVSGLHGVSAGHATARLDTAGGHIQVLDVAGDVTAFTAGGHISVGNISGDASLHSGGGHIRAGQINGRADLQTVGGNITVAHAGNVVNVRTGGGQIDFGEVRGSVHAQTGGGGIRIMNVSGPMEVESSGGSIVLTRIAGAVQAATGEGTITAWFNPDSPPAGETVRLAGASQLSSGNGDIVVFLPRNLAADIEATVGKGDQHRIEADPALHLTMQTIPGQSTGGVRATCTLNGGGAPLRLHTAGGKIRLRYLDSETSLHESLLRQQVERLNERMRELEVETIAFPPVPPAPPTMPDQALPKISNDWIETWVDTLQALTGGLRENPDDFKTRLTYFPNPPYPALAQRAGVQGVVKLQVRVLKDGRMEVQKLLEGEPSLADAAIATVKQWRAKPGWINGKPVEVISVVTFNFLLH